MKIGYSAFVKLCRVDDPEEWDPGLSIRSDGVYVKAPPVGLTPNEMAILSKHPTGNLNDPALRFPCDLKRLKQFIEFYGLHGYIDSFDLADWIQEQGTDLPVLGSGREHVSKKLAYLNQAANQFWSRADKGDKGTFPDTKAVVQWLTDKEFPETLAEKAATIIRPEWAGTGRRPEK